MLADSIRNMKLDRRLVNRKGWVDEAELDSALKALPDLADKGCYAEEEDAAEGSGGGGSTAG